MNKLVVIGSGGHAGVVIESWHRGGWKGAEIVGILDDMVEPGQTRHGLQVLGPATPQFVPDKCSVMLAIGDNDVRFQVFNRFPQDTKWATVADPIALIMNGSHLGCGSFMAPHTHIGPNSKTGAFCILNTGVVLEHDCSLGNFTHLAPRAVTGGRVKIGSHTFIGLGALIRDGITIGDHCVVGMGSVVTKDVKDNTVVFGNPARKRQLCA